MIFEQGDIIEVNFNPTVGHEPQKRRPAVVLSDGLFNNTISNLVVVCPITSSYNGHPLHIKLDDSGEVFGCLCIEAMRAIDLNDPKRGTKHLNISLDEKTMAQALEAIGAVFGI